MVRTKTNCVKNDIRTVEKYSNQIAIIHLLRLSYAGAIFNVWRRLLNYGQHNEKLLNPQAGLGENIESKQRKRRFLEQLAFRYV